MLSGRGNHLVTRLPGEAHDRGIHALGGIVGQRDFKWIAAEQSGKGCPRVDQSLKESRKGRHADPALF